MGKQVFIHKIRPYLPSTFCLEKPKQNANTFFIIVADFVELL